MLKRIRAIREERYSLFRGFFHGATDMSDAAENLQPRLHSVHLPERAHALGRALAALELAGLVEVTGVPKLLPACTTKVAEGMDVKTDSERFEALRLALLELHPYEVPELIATRIEVGHGPYLEWFDRSLRSDLS